MYCNICQLSTKAYSKMHAFFPPSHLVLCSPSVWAEGSGESGAISWWRCASWASRDSDWVVERSLRSPEAAEACTRKKASTAGCNTSTAWVSCVSPSSTRHSDSVDHSSSRFSCALRLPRSEVSVTIFSYVHLFFLVRVGKEITINTALEDSRPHPTMLMQCKGYIHSSFFFFSYHSMCMWMKYVNFWGLHCITTA